MKNKNDIGAKKTKKTVKNCELVNSIVNIPPSKSDPNGSYTGNCMDPFEKPVQDADDL